MPDGYTFCVYLSDTVVINPSAYKKLPYSPADFTPVAQLARIDAAVVVSAELPIKSIADLAKYDAANPGKLSWGPFGVGSSSHLCMTKVNSQLGTKFFDIPYQGGGPTMNALLSGQVQASLLSYGLVSQHIDQGKLRAIGVLGDKSSPRFAGVPLLKDLGFGYSPQSWIGMFAPAGTSVAIVDRVNKEVKTALQDPELIKALESQGLAPSPMTPQELDTQVKADLAEWSALVKAANISLD